MSICLGNLSVEEIQKRLGITLTESEQNKLSSKRQEVATNIARDKWHCFDLPFTIACGSYDTAVFVKDILEPYAKEMKTQVQISIGG